MATALKGEAKGNGGWDPDAGHEKQNAVIFYYTFGGKANKKSKADIFYTSIHKLKTIE